LFKLSHQIIDDLKTNFPFKKKNNQKYPR